LWLQMLVIGLLATVLAACRVPETRLGANPSVGTIYDPKTTDAIAARFPQSPEQKALTDCYRTALAEPVSVVSWEPKRSTSQIFYVTNRKPLFADGHLSYGCQYGQELSLGTCRITLPKRERGKDVEMAKPKVSLVSWLNRSDKSAAETPSDAT